MQFRSRRRRRFLESCEPPGLGNLQARPARDAIPRPPIRLLRTDGGPQSRHPTLRPRPPEIIGLSSWSPASRTGVYFAQDLRPPNPLRAKGESRVKNLILFALALL